MTSKQWCNYEAEPAMDSDLPIIDAHHHIWSAPQSGIFDAYTVDDVIDDKIGSGHNVIATVLVDSHMHHLSDGPVALRPVGETIYCDKLAQEADRKGGRTAGLCNFWVGLLSLPGVLIPFFKTGPFAWDGLLAFWLPLVVFGIWGPVMIWAMQKAGPGIGERPRIAL